jgi:hypothetical protein
MFCVLFSEMGLLDMLKLDSDSDLEVDAGPLGPSEEEMASLHAKTAYTGQDYASIFSTDDFSSSATPIMKSPKHAVPTSKPKKKAKVR